TAAAAAGNPAITRVAMNCAPALSPDGTTVYITVTSGFRGVLVGLNAATLQPRFHVLLKDPVSGKPAAISPSSSASPTVGPDGDGYYGVQENPFASHDGRGWLLHYDATFTQTTTPGSFGWDDTLSVLPARPAPPPSPCSAPARSTTTRAPAPPSWFPSTTTTSAPARKATGTPRSPSSTPGQARKTPTPTSGP